jgi:hypothetical protein
VVNLLEASGVLREDRGENERESAPDRRTGRPFSLVWDHIKLPHLARVGAMTVNWTFGAR